MYKLSVVLIVSFLFTGISAKDRRIGEIPYFLNGIKANQSVLPLPQSKTITLLPQQLPYAPANRQNVTNHRVAGYYKEKLDSIVSVGYEKYAYIYNDNGCAVSAIYYTWEGGAWHEYWKYEYAYNNSGKIISSIEYFWDAGELHGFKGDFSYDAVGRMISAVFQQLENSQWVNREKFAYTYDYDGNLILYTISEWKSGQWTNYFKTDYIYSNGKSMIQVMAYAWISDHWENNYKFEHACNGNGKIVSSLGYEWKDTQWVSAEKAECSYNKEGRITMFAYYIQRDGQWENDSKYEYAYDDHGNMILWIWYDGERDRWINFEKSVITYDLSGSMTDIALLRYPEVPDVLIWLLLLGISNDPCVNKIGSGYQFAWDSTASVWNLESNIKYHYSPFIIPIVNRPIRGTTAPCAFSARRDPSGALLLLTNHTGAAMDISVYSIQGKAVMRFLLPKTGAAVDVSAVPSGVYLVTPTNTKISFSAMLHIQR